MEAMYYQNDKPSGTTLTFLHLVPKTTIQSNVKTSLKMPTPTPLKHVEAQRRQNIIGVNEGWHNVENRKGRGKGYKGVVFKDNNSTPTDHQHGSNKRKSKTKVLVRELICSRNLRIL